MLDMKLNAAKGLFFDRKAVTNATDRATVKAMSKAGAFVRTASRQSIRTRKRESNPGDPPTNRTGLLKRNIVFVYEPEKKGVVVGPVLLNGRNGAKILQSLEFGGESETEKLFFRTRDGRTVAERRRMKIQVEARPFMRPAMEREDPKFAELFRGTVTK